MSRNSNAGHSRIACCIAEILETDCSLASPIQRLVSIVSPSSFRYSLRPRSRVTVLCVVVLDGSRSMEEGLKSSGAYGTMITES